MDTGCPFHPSNHDKGCTLCIAKNLKEREIPTCFFKTVDYPKPSQGWLYEDFAALIVAEKECRFNCSDNCEVGGRLNETDSWKQNNEVI